MTSTIKAIKSLLGNAEWSIFDEDLSTLQIHTLGVTAPTEVEIKAEVKRMADAEKAKPAQKQAILDRLGLTAEEAALLVG